MLDSYDILYADPKMFDLITSFLDELHLLLEWIYNAEFEHRIE